MYFRKIYPLLKQHLKRRQVTVLTGMRRTGKTTLVKGLLSEIKSGNKLYLDLERLDNRDIFSQRNYEAILNSLKQYGIKADQPAYVALDEIQLAPGLPSAIKYLYDHYPIKFIVTGSSSYYLKNFFSESLAGRKKVFELSPLDFSEFLTFKKVAHADEPFIGKKFNSAEFNRLGSYYEEYVNYGGFPEVALTDKAEAKKDLLYDIFDSFIKIDVKALADFRDLANLEKLLKMMAARVGTKLDYAKLSRLTGISRPTVVNYIDFLEKTYMISRLPVYSKSPDREIVKAPKLYFSDNGLLNILAEVGSGSKFENAVFNQLRAHGALKYYSLKTGKEIDFIINGAMAVEVKESPLADDLRPLRDLAVAAKVKASRLIGRYQVPNFDDYIWAGEIR